MASLEHPTLALAGLVALAAGSVYLYVAEEFRRRAARAPPADAHAVVAFATWWYALGANIVLGATLYLAAAFGWTDFSVQATYAYLQRLLLAVSLFGLLYYLLYLVTGRAFARTLLTYYTLYFVLLLYLLQASQPAGVYIGQWRVDVAPTQQAPPVLSLLNLAALILPPVLASLAYFRIYFKLPRGDARAQRYRIALVSWAIILWWVMAVLAGQREAFGHEYFQLVNRMFGLAAALVILAAYKPPARIRSWLQARAPRPTAA